MLKRIALVSLGAHLFFGAGLARMEIPQSMTPGIWSVDEKRVVEIHFLEESPPLPAVVRPPVPLPPALSKGNPRPKASEEGEVPKGRKSGGGGGDPLARVTRMGLLGKLSGSTEGTRVSSVEGGVAHAADGMAQLLRGAGVARRTAGVQARGEPGIGFGDGVGSGFGGGVATQEAQDLVASFGDGNGAEIVLDKKGVLSDGSELPFIEGGGCREEGEIARVVQSHRGGIRGCYNRSLIHTPGQQGEVGVRFIIDTEGRVSSAEVLSRTFHDPELERCILDRIVLWTFLPEPGCETVVRYSFHFSSGM